MFRTIGPVWDGNEVWLVVAGGAMFAAFPTWYATMFSGFYIALLLLLVFLIVRVLSFEWRERHEHSRWLGVWAWANTIGSLGAALIWGVAFSNLLYGVPINSSGDFDGTFWDLFSLYTLLGGVAVVLLFAFHGATYLTLRTTGELCRRAAAAARRLSIATAVVGAGFLIWTVAVAVDRNDKDVFPPLLPALLAIVALVGAAVCVRLARSGWAFVLTAAGAVPRRGDDLHEPLSARHGRQQRLRQQPHRRQRLLGALHAQGDERRGADRRAGHPALPGLDVPRLPSAARRRGRADRRPISSHARPAPRQRMGPLDPRLVRRARRRARAARARRRSRRRRRAARPRAGRPDRHRRGPRLRRGFSRRARPRRSSCSSQPRSAGRRPPPASSSSAGALRPMCSGAAAGRRSSSVGFAIVPAALDGAESAEVATAAVGGVDALETTFARYLPQVVLAVTVPVAVLVFVAAIDPVSAGRDVADAAARAGVHVARRPLHGAACPRALADARAPRDALPRRRARPADASRVQPRRGADGADRCGERAVPPRRRWRRCASRSSRGRCSSSRPRSGIALVAVTVGVRLVEGGLGFEAGLDGPRPRPRALPPAPQPRRAVPRERRRSRSGATAARSRRRRGRRGADGRRSCAERPGPCPCGSRTSRSPTPPGRRSSSTGSTSSFAQARPWLSSARAEAARARSPRSSCGSPSRPAGG